MQRVSHTPLEVGIRSELKVNSDSIVHYDTINTNSCVVQGYEIDPSNILTLAIVASAVQHLHTANQDKIAAETVTKSILEGFDKAPNFYSGFSLLKKGFELAHHRIVGNGNSEVYCSAVVVTNDSLIVASIGGCRVFLSRNQQIYQISRTDYWLEQQIEQGHISIDEAFSVDVHGPHRAIGSPHIELKNMPDFQILNFPLLESDESIKLIPGDQLIITDPGIFGGYIHPASSIWKLFVKLFSNDTHPQIALDHFITSLLSEQLSGSYSVLALRVPPKLVS